MRTQKTQSVTKGGREKEGGREERREGERGREGEKEGGDGSVIRLPLRKDFIMEKAEATHEGRRVGDSSSLDFIARAGIISLSKGQAGRMREDSRG